MLDLLIPDKSKQASLSASNPPQNINPAFGDSDSLLAALDQAQGITSTSSNLIIQSNNKNVSINIPLSEQTRRSFHPKGTAYKQHAAAFMAAIKANRMPLGAAQAQSTPTTSAASSIAPPAPSSTAPYAQGTCSLHLRQWKDPNKPTNGNYKLEVTIYDNDHKQIGYQGQTLASASSPLHVKSLLEDPLVCVPEEHNDYVQFALGNQAWPSDGGSNQQIVPRCMVGGWDEHLLEYVRF